MDTLTGAPRQSSCDYQRIAVGTLVSDAEFAAQLLNDGFTFVACGSDTGLLARGSDSQLASVRQKLN